MYCVLEARHGMNSQVSGSGLKADLGIPHRRWLPLLAFFAVGFDYRLSVGTGPTLAVLEVVAFIAMAIWLLDLVWNQRRVMSETLAAARSLGWVVAYFAWAWVTVWLGLTRSVDNLWAFRNIFPGLVVAFVVMVHVRDGRDARHCLTAFLGGVAINLVLATSQKFFGRPYPNALHAGALIKMDLEGKFVTNTPAGFFVHPNGLAVFLIPAIIVLVVGFRAGLFRAALWRWLLQWPLAALAGAILYLTYAKGALLWVALGLAMCFAPRWSRRRLGWLAAAMLAVIPLLVFVGSDPFRLGFRTLNSMMTRLDIWKAAFQAMAADPYVLAFGNGFGAIYRASLRLSELPYPNAHNNVLNQVIFFGLPALALYLIAFATTVRRAGMAMRTRDDDALLLALVATLVALVGEHFFEPVLDSVALQAQYYAFLALVLTQAKQQASMNTSAATR